MSEATTKDSTVTSSTLDDEQIESSDGESLNGNSQETVSDQVLTVDVIFEALKNERRRRVVTHLEEAAEPLDLGDVAERIAAYENDTSVPEITYSERKRVYVALYQHHLPKLDDMGIISFNKSRGILELAAGAEQLKPYLKGRQSSRPWYKYDAGIIAGGITVLAGVWATGLLSVAGIQIALTTLLTTVFLCAVAHTWSVR
ncbi:putative trancriptional regulator, ArsR family [Halapricum desulfuricans]|uniref:Putative trancriptional regulator, ArsR family n=1 Tax=Halapricum desulfuricans TaxID=2841257 RepID=A0A897NK97_9EURY|nr:hypothetical protein [Halapricum desulfuricans]QSG11383.1 putative trancriptional regulator, ArsR family [Halapricum desulfuricans]